MRPLIFDDLDLSFVPSVVRCDSLWQRCISLALQSRSEDQRYGAVVLDCNSQMLGSGHNRRLGRGEPCPFRTSFFLHAETDALRHTLLTHREEVIHGARLAVAGFMVRTRRPFIRRQATLHEGSCVRCARLNVRYGVSPLIITEEGWKELPNTTALENAERTLAYLRTSGTSLREHRMRIAL